MEQRVHTLRKSVPYLLFQASKPTALWVDRIVFNTEDPKWSQRIAGAQLNVLMSVSEDDEDGGVTRAMQLENQSIGLLNRNTFIRPVFDIKGGWEFTPRPVVVSNTPHTWVHGIMLGGGLKLQDNESIEISIRTSSEFMDVEGMIEDLNVQRFIQQN